MDDLAPDIAVDQVLYGQGIDAESASPRLPELRAVAERALRDYRHWLEPRIVSTRLRVVAFEADAVRLEAGPPLTGRQAAHRFRGASEVVFAVCTVGEAVSRLAASLMDGDPLTALAVEGLACAGVDGLSAAFCAEERRRASAAGMCVTAPLSPGMDGWALDEGQRTLFAHVDAASIGVRLSESFQMCPTKSASFVLGVGVNVPQDEGDACSRCSARDRCAWRRGRAPGTSMRNEK